MSLVFFFLSTHGVSVCTLLCVRRFYSRLLELRRRIKANSLPLLPAASITPIKSGGSSSGEDVTGGGSTTTTTTNTIHSTNNRSREQTVDDDLESQDVVLRVKRYRAGRSSTFPPLHFHSFCVSTVAVEVLLDLLLLLLLDQSNELI